MIQLQQKPGRTTIIDGKEYLFFSGYSYLGLGCHEKFLHLIKQGIDEYGVVYPSSRISNTPLQVYTAFENKLAALTHTEAAVVFSSGFLSARTAVEIIAEEMNVYCMAPAHPASSHHHQAKLITTDWNTFLDERVKANELKFALAIDSINPTPGRITDFNFLKEVPSSFHIILIVDDSHGIGWMGANGEGIISKLNLPSTIELLLNFSLSKAYHLNAGAVCGSEKWVEKAKQHINFTTSTPPMPALAHAFLHAGEIFEQQRNLLHQNIQYLQNLTSTFTFAANEGTPVFVVNKQSVAPYLLQNNVIISSFGYPRPENSPVNRVVVNALHLKSDLEKLAQLMEQF
ncbi:MAG: aminotransferase class I/II-fold pyridoxal phosphate-dependent enzyme [Chitinophagaceae bacterium]|nr:aminotransferase class I/II-fold pyridoxal phosphate-dependent enzyme [Chitinophagaceae bacterium]